MRYIYMILVNYKTNKQEMMDVLVRVFIEKRQFGNSENNEHIIYRAKSKVKEINRFLLKSGTSSPRKW